MAAMASDLTPFDAFEARMVRVLADRVHDADVELNRLHGEAIKGGYQNNSGTIKPQLEAVQHCAERSIQMVLGEAKALTDPHRARAWYMWLEHTAAPAREVLVAHVEALYALRWRINSAVLPVAKPIIEDSKNRILAAANGEVDDFERGVWSARPVAARAAPPTTAGTDVAQSPCSDGGTGGEKGHVFISYVREDAAAAEYVVSVLRENGVKVFWDRDIQAGQRWPDVIREAIKTGAYFVPLFSRQWEARIKSVANEELMLAREQLRLMPRDRTWYVGVRIDECNVPNDPIGAGETLGDLQYVDIPARGWGPGLEDLLRAVGAAHPKLAVGDPLGPRSLQPSTHHRRRDRFQGMYD